MQHIFLVSFTSFQRNRSRKAIRGQSREVLTCDSEWYPFGDMCYKLGAKKPTGFQTWEKARQTCQALGGNLASIHSKKLQDFLQIFLQQKIKSHVWIGLNDHKTEGVWEWEDGTPIDFLYWDDNEPNIKNHEEDCVMMYYEGPHRVKEYGVWHDWHCNGDCSFICQKKKRSRFRLPSTLDPRFCPDGGWQHDTSCFHLIKQKMSWSKAEDYCINSHGGHLATILDNPTNRFIQYVFGSEVPRSWIGIKINGEHLQQKWTSGWFVSYEKWDDTPIGCSTLISSGNWSSADCSTELPFICEVSSVSPPSMPPGLEGSHCPQVPPGWRDLGGKKCYFIEKEKYASWQDANFKCLRMGGVLASIHSQNESDVLHYFVKGATRAIFIGIHRSSLHEEDFAWSDGSPMDFINWSPNEPNYSGEQCGEMLPQNSRWNDVTCSEGRGFICSVKKLIAEETSAEEKSCLNGYSLTALLGAMFFVLCTCILAGLLAYYYGLCDRKQSRCLELIEDPYEEMQLKN